jgi:SAM-dependent methyltransferase
MTFTFSVPADWHETFFSDAVLRFWDAVIPPQATAADVAFITRHVAPPPAAIIDMQCGTGRHASALARAGFNVTAVDASAPALERARARGDAGVRLERSDCLEFEPDAPADALICMGNSIGYFEPRLTQKLLGRFAAMLRNGGRLILDTGICAESILPLAEERRISFPGGCYDQEIYYDCSASTLNTRAHLTMDGMTRELRYRHYVMTSGELVRMLRAAGFHVSGLYGDTGDGAFMPGSPRLLIDAAKDES